MNLIELQNGLKASLREAARELFDIELDQPAVEVPPRTELGDLAFPIAFELAKQIKQKGGEKRAPRTIAEAIKSRLETIDEVARVEVAGAGYLNVFFDRASLLAELSTTSVSPPGWRTGETRTTASKLMVEQLQN